jgi:hypothetical protein
LLVRFGLAHARRPRDHPQTADDQSEQHELEHPRQHRPRGFVRRWKGEEPGAEHALHEDGHSAQELAPRETRALQVHRIPRADKRIQPPHVEAARRRSW